MPGPYSNPAGKHSEKHQISQAISVVHVLLCLALAGCSQDDQPTAPPALVEFVFPLEAGTTWHYRYSWYDYRATYMEQHGHQVWQSTGTGAQGSVKILVTRTDTARSWNYYGADTTTQITQKDTSFFIIVTPESLYIQYYHLTRDGTSLNKPDLFRIPRRVQPNTEYFTLMMGGQASYRGTVYFNGKGLTQWVDRSGTMSDVSFTLERLILESMSP